MPAGPWTDATDRRLLLSIIHLTAPQLPKWDQVATLMGDGFTAESVRQHFQKMRKACKDQFGEPGSGTPGASAKGTPRKTKAAKAAKSADKTPTKSTGKRKEKNNVEVEGDDEEEDASPSKKIKAEITSFEDGHDIDWA